jgi:hypothetical protein
MKFENTARGIVDIVQMAKMANVKIIIGSTGLGLEGDPENLGFLGSWLQQFAQNENVPIVNFTPLYVGCNSEGQCPLLDPNPSPSNGGLFSITVPNAAGFQVITQMAQAAIATYNLKIKGGYLSDLEIFSGAEGSLPTPPTNINTVAPGATLQFTPQATWTDGVTRPMTNVPYGGVLGTWWSTNPKVAAVDQHGVVNAYTPGTAQIWFETSTGQTFSPWGITVVQWPGETAPTY